MHRFCLFCLLSDRISIWDINYKRFAKSNFKCKALLEQKSLDKGKSQIKTTRLIAHFQHCSQIRQIFVYYATLHCFPLGSIVRIAYYARLPSLPKSGKFQNSLAAFAHVCVCLLDKLSDNLIMVHAKFLFRSSDYAIVHANATDRDCSVGYCFKWFADKCVVRLSCCGPALGRMAIFLAATNEQTHILLCFFFSMSHWFVFSKSIHLCLYKKKQTAAYTHTHKK